MYLIFAESNFYPAVSGVISLNVSTSVVFGTLPSCLYL